MSSYLPVAAVPTNTMEESPSLTVQVEGQAPIRAVKVLWLLKCLDCFALIEEKDADFHTNYHTEA